MALNIEPVDRNQTTAFREREALRQKVNEIIETVTPMEFQWDAVPTAGHGVGYVVTSEGVKTAIDNEATIRRAEDIGLSDAIAAEETARNDADDALGLLIRTEENTRAEADTALGTRIDNESTARADQDTALGLRIDNESTARGNADTALGARIDGKQNVLTQGTGITIENDVISATGGGSITAGTGIQIVDGVISQTNTRFQTRNTVTANFFTNVQNRLTNTTPFLLSLWDTDSTVSQLGLLTFTGARPMLGKFFGTGMLVYNSYIYSIYEVDGLDTSTDTITVYGFNMTMTGMETVTLSKNTLISQGTVEGYFNVGVV